MPRFCLLLLVVMIASGQNGAPREFPDDKGDIKPFGGQKQEMLKAEHKHSVEDAQKLAELSTEVRDDLEKSDPNVVSLKTIKQLDEIERLTKRIRGRLKRI
jgi:hypothetical protein